MPLFFQRHIFQAGKFTPEMIAEARAGAPAFSPVANETFTFRRIGRS